MAGGLGRAQGGYDEMVFRAMVRDDAHFYEPAGARVARDDGRLPDRRQRLPLRQRASSRGSPTRTGPTS